MMIAASAACGRSRNSGVSQSSVARIAAAQTSMLNCVRPPAASLTLERVKLPATG